MTNLVEAAYGLGLVMLVAVLLALSLAVLGNGVSLLFRRRFALPGGFTFPIGLGFLVVAVIVPFGYLLHLPLEFLSILLMAIGISINAIALITSMRKRRFAGWSTFIDRKDLLLGLVALVVLSPVAIYGMTYWTLDANDMPAYAAFANVWLSGASPSDPNAFLAQHPDPYGQWAVEWADFDKLGASASLVFASSVTGIAPMLLQTPITIVVLFTTLGLIFQIVRRRGCSDLQALLIAIATGLGLFPINFLLNGQLGHILAAVYLLLGIVLVQNRARLRVFSRSAVIGNAALVGLALYAAFMANFLVTASVVPVVITLWILTVGGSVWSARDKAIFLASALIVALLVLAPFLSRHLEALKYLGTGEIGPKYFLASPVALVGLQWSLDSIAPNAQILILWVVVAVMGITIAWRQILQRKLTLFWVGGVVGLNGLLLGFYIGFDNYGFAKWTAMSSLLLVPIVLAVIFRHIQIPRAGKFLGMTVGAAAVATATHLAMSVPFVMPRALFDAVQNPRVREVRALAVDLGNYFEDGTAATILGNSQVYVLKPTHANGYSGEGFDATLVRTEDRDRSSAGNLEPINDLYGLLIHEK